MLFSFCSLKFCSWLENTDYSYNLILCDIHSHESRVLCVNKSASDSWDCCLENLWQTHTCGYILNTFPWSNTRDVRLIQLRNSEVRIGHGDNVHNLSWFLLLLLLTQHLISAGSSHVSVWFLTELSVIQIRGRWKEEGGGGREEGGRGSEAPGMIKGGAVLRVTHPRTHRFTGSVRGRSFTEVTWQFKANHWAVAPRSAVPYKDEAKSGMILSYWVGW